MLAQRVPRTLVLVKEEVAASTAPAEAVAVVRLESVVDPKVVEAEEERLVNEPVPPTILEPAMVAPVRLVTVVEASVEEPVTTRLPSVWVPETLEVVALVVVEYKVVA